jgi:hypothetical protein
MSAHATRHAGGCLSQAPRGSRDEEDMARVVSLVERSAPEVPFADRAHGEAA